MRSANVRTNASLCAARDVRMRVVNDRRVDPGGAEQRLGRKVVSLDQAPDDLSHARQRCVFHHAVDANEVGRL